MKKILTILMILGLMMPLNVKASSTYIEKMTIDTTIQSNGDAHIKEVWKMEVDEGSEVYKVMNNMNNKRIKNLKVRDEDNHQFTNIGKWNVDASMKEKEYKCGLVTTDDGYELCFGIGKYGPRTYTFEYDVTHFVEQYNGNQGFNFAFFSELSLPIDEARITVSCKNHQFSEDNSSIYAYGYEGYVVFNSGRVVMGLDEPLDSDSNKMQLLMRIDDGTFKNLMKTDRTFDDILDEANEESEYLDDEDDDSFSFVGILVCIFLIAITGVGLREYLHRKKRIFEDGTAFKVPKDINVFRDIPCDKNLFLFYYLCEKIGYVTNGTKGGLIAAILLKWIQKGYITFDKHENGKHKKKSFSIDLSDNRIQTDNSYEESLLKMFKQAAGKNMKLESGEFERWCEKHYKKMNHWFARITDDIEDILVQCNDIIIRDGKRRFLGLSFKCEEEVYSSLMQQYIYEIAGFKKFLDELTLMNEKEVLEVKLWEDYLIYASILGMADQVEKQLGKLYPEFEEESYIDIYYATGMIRSFSNHAVIAANNAASSVDGSGGTSSFTGGGGSFSGGGGGGVR